MTSATVDTRLQLAFQLYGDVVEQVAQQPSFSLLLDHAVLSMEFRRALGSDCGADDPAAALADAMGALRTATGVGPWLYRGAAQAGWTAIQLARSRGTRPPRLSVIDDIVLAWVRDYPDRCDLDLPMGITGLGVYALAHPDPVVRDTLVNGVLDVVERRAERSDQGLFFRLAETPERVRDGSAGCRVIGVAHGTAGLVAFLASVVLSGLEARDRAETALSESLAWLLAQRADVGHTVFPHRVELRYAPSRATWCSGDVGVALALELAARATGSRAATAALHHTATAVLARTDAECGAVDACICHGAAGLAWFGRRMQGDLDAGAAAFATRWEGWIAEQRAQEPLRYFSPWGMIRDASFLEGDAGVALVLLQSVVGGSAAWEELLLAKPVGLG